MDAIRDEYLATSARDEGISARQIVRHHQFCIESLARAACRRLLREAIGLYGAATSDLFVVLLGSTVREAFGAQRLDLYRWYCLPRSETVLGELFLAAIPHPSPLASRVFNQHRVARLLDEMHDAPVRRPTRARGYRRIERLGLVPLEE